MVEVAILATLTLFFMTAIAEIGGGYLIWQWLRNHKRLLFGIFGGVILFGYGIIPTFNQQALEGSMLLMEEYS